MVPTPNHSYANSFSNYYVIMIVRFLKKLWIKVFYFQGTKCRDKKTTTVKGLLCERHTS